MGELAGLTPDRKLADEWQLWKTPAEPPLEADELATALADETRKPALVALVMDSDCLVIEASDIASGSWTACLSPKNAAAYLAEEGERIEDWILSPDRAAQHALDWVRSLGRTVDIAPLVDIFKREADPFVEDLFFDLLKQLNLIE